MKNKFYTEDISILQEEISRCQKNVAYADLYIQKAATHSTRFEDGKIEQVTSSVSDGIGARIIKNGHSFLSSSDGTTLKNGLGALRNVAEISGEALNFTDCSNNVSVFTGDLNLSRPNVDFFASIEEKFKSLDSKSKYIKHTNSSFSVAKKRVIIIKGDGEIACKDCASTVFNVGCVVEKNGVLETASERRCLTLSEENFWQDDAPAAIA